MIVPGCTVLMHDTSPCTAVCFDQKFESLMSTRRSTFAMEVLPTSANVRKDTSDWTVRCTTAAEQQSHKTEATLER